MLLSIFAELSFRTAYSTGKHLNDADLFATVVIVHLCVILTRDWIDGLDAGLNLFLGKTWLRMAKRE